MKLHKYFLPCDTGLKQTFRTLRYQMLGRIMSFFAMAFMGTVPLGSLLAGGSADLIGAPRTLMIGGFCCVLGALAYTSKLPLLRDMVILSPTEGVDLVKRY
jgi:predicted membrane channel-forming protein YqfA (hemolysin III family)